MTSRRPPEVSPTVSSAPVHAVPYHPGVAVWVLVGTLSVVPAAVGAWTVLRWLCP